MKSRAERAVLAERRLAVSPMARLPVTNRKGLPQAICPHLPQVEWEERRPVLEIRPSLSSST